MKTNKGITLIALVITIVVLIILAGVAISLSIGENGIFNKAKYATEQYANEQAKEETEIAKLTNQIDGYVSGNRNGITSFNFSTEERVIGTWIDGKPIYQKTIDFGGLPNNTTKTVNHGVDNLKRIIDIFGYCYSGTDGWTISLIRPGFGAYDIAVAANSTVFYVQTVSDLSNYSECYVTIQYTKTIDWKNYIYYRVFANTI